MYGSGSSADLGLLLLLGLGLVALLIHLWLAGAAAGRKGYAAWGLFGPAGVIVAAAKGLHARMNELEEQRRKDAHREKVDAQRARIDRERALEDDLLSA